MTDFLAQLMTWLNVPMNALGESVLPLISVLPGWLSNTIISAVTGVLLLLIFKYTSNQRAIGRVRDDIKAHMLALKLFKDSIAVTVRAQGHVFKGAFLLLFHAVRPMLVMMVPVCLLLAQLGLWYQSRPLRPGEEAIVTMKLNGSPEAVWPDVTISSIPTADVTIGPVKVLSKREINWQITARREGKHPIVFAVDQKSIEKELVVGNGFTRLSAQRPGWRWSDILLHPAEKPFSGDATVQSISITYPDRLSHTSGTDWWMIYFFVASMVFALLLKPFFKVRI